MPQVYLELEQQLRDKGVTLHVDEPYRLHYKKDMMNAWVPLPMARTIDTKLRMPHCEETS